MQFIGQKLRTLRKARNKTMVVLAEETGVKQGALSQIENEVKNPRPDTVEKIANALGVDPQYFYIQDAKLTIELLPDMPEELKEFLMNEKNMPYIVLSKEAQENGIPPEIIKTMIDAIIAAKNIKK